MDEIQIKSPKKIKIFDVVLISVLLLLILFLIFVCKFWISLSVVEGNSMNYTLANGDILITDMIKKPKRGDVVVFKHNETANYIKRVIAVGGDTIYNDDDGNLYIIKAGESKPTLIIEPYIADGIKAENNIYCVVPNGEYYVLGDNRPISEDSRYIGTIKEEQIIGVVSNFWIENKNITNTIFAFRR